MMRILLAGLLLAGAVLAAAMYKPSEQIPDQPKAEIKSVTAKPTVVLPDALEWPANYPLVRSQQLAYARLFRAWGADYQEGDACIQAENIGLSCMSARGSLDELRQFNLPAVLLMQDKQGQKFSATMTRLDERSATFSIGDVIREVSLGSFAEQWSGHYTLLWRPPHVTNKKLIPGDQGPDVEWLARQLALLEGKVADITPNPLFDETMMRRVKQFQLSHGLIPDGSVGPQTMMRMSIATDAAAPKLGRTQERK
jgi:general secretion pathway protein A